MIFKMTGWIVIDADGPYYFTLAPKRKDAIRFFIHNHPSECWTTWAKCRRDGCRCVKLECTEVK